MLRREPLLADEQDDRLDDPRVELRARAAGELGAAVAAAFAGTAAAPVGAAGSCGDLGAQIFLPWGDSLFYSLAAGGSAESADGWTFSGDSRVIKGNEPFDVNSPSDSRSVFISAGDSATSPWTCLGAESPVARLFALAQGPSSARLQVEVLYKTRSGEVGTLRPEFVSAADHVSWAPTAHISVGKALQRSGLNGNALLDTAEIAFRFTASDEATWRIDDLYVDPWAEKLFE